MNRGKAAFSATKLIYDKETKPEWLDKCQEPMATLIFDYKKAFQNLQLTILEGESNNCEKIGRCFEELEIYFGVLNSTLAVQKTT